MKRECKFILSEEEITCVGDKRSERAIEGLSQMTGLSDELEKMVE